MCLEAGIEESFDLPTDHINIRLPPKQFLLMVESQFFDQADYMTDIFVRSSFWSNVDRIYSRALRPADDAWAICFSTIILLVLGSECFARGNDQVLGSQFLEPFLSTIPAALSNSHILLAPKLINVQALALLYFSPGLAESVFAQACVLARTMGLHQTYSVSNGVGPEEALERFKVLRSLYLRDKSLSISQGSVCWLSSVDCSLSSEFDQTGFADADFSVRIELAQLQEDIYRLFHAPERRRQPFTKHWLALSGIEQRLDRWANIHGIFSSHEPQDIHLQLEFLATRISAFRGSSEPSHVRQALDGARASCRLLLRSYGNNDPFDTIPFGRTPSSSVGAAAKGETANWESSSNAGQEKDLLFHRLLDMFPVTAFFSLAKNLLLSVSVEEESQAVQDINLLQNVCSCYEELDARTQANNYIRKVGRAFKTVLEVVNLIRNSPQQPMSPVPSSIPDIQPSTKKLLSRSHGLSSFTGPPTPSAYTLPRLCRDDFLTRSISTGMMEMTCQPASDISSFVAPATSGQHYFSPQIQSQTEVSQRKRPRLGETDISVDDHLEFRLLSDFLGGSPMMPFDGSL
ncbi:hypothetical protein VTN00DRAFT_5060 [Thermoascus crustaceus]|uniref:uncharacterized protein n=1 Tax=Thermoascus crustaceus TaxID=5088 RepID=UPI003743AD78